MKPFNLLIIVAVFFSASVFGQESDLPGEGFDLEALAGIIENVSTFEDLEKAPQVICKSHSSQFISR